MPAHPDLFEPSYPAAPGYRETDTSKTPADFVRPKLSVTRAKVIEALKVRPMTSFEIAAHHRARYESIQPRCAELRALGEIEDSGTRGISRDPTKTAIVWRLKTA